MIAVWESDISATFLIFPLKCSTDAVFFELLVFSKQSPEEVKNSVCLNSTKKKIYRKIPKISSGAYIF